MKFIPYERLTIHTRLHPEQALQKLEETVEPKRLFRWPGSAHKPYQGNLNGYFFDIARVSEDHNSFQPMISGSIQFEMGGSAISITMHPNPLAIAFIIVWLGTFGIIFLPEYGRLILSLLEFLEQDLNSLGMLLIPLGMFVLGYGLLYVGFKVESIKSKKFFRALFQAERVEEMGISDLFERDKHFN